MSSTLDEPRILHELPGRLRLHAPSWSGAAPGALEQGLAELDGVERATASPLTRNVLVRFDARAVGTAAILRRIATLTAPAAMPPAAPPAAREFPAARAAPRQTGTPGRVRVGVRGLERDPAFAAHVARRLAGIAGVAAVSVSRLTGRALVELDEEVSSVPDLAAEIARLEDEFDAVAEPALRDPIDTEAMTMGAARLAGSTLGLVLLLARQAIGRRGPPTESARPVVAAALIGVAEGMPPLRRLIRGVVGDRGADIALGSTGLAASTLAGKTLGVAVGAGAALRAVTALRGRHGAWREYDERTGGLPPREGARVLVPAGDRAPVDGIVLEGCATALDRDGMPLAATPGTLVPAGARLLGGPVALELRPPPGFPRAGPRPSRPEPPAERFAAVAGAVALGVAVAVGLAGRSATAALMTLQLLNPRPATQARQAAQHGAAARVVRAGVTVVGTRPDRPLERPDVVLLDGARLMTDGFEVVRTMSLTPELSASEVVARASEVAAAAGWPWGRVPGGGRGAPAAEGSFDGRTATATLDGTTYRLTLADRPPELGREPGTFGLVLAADDAPGRLGAFLLRPRLAAGLAELRATCERSGAQLVLLIDRPDRPAAHALAERARLGVLDVEDAVRAVRGLQRSARVAVVSDSAAAGALFDACDLAIAVSSGRSGQFAARADLLAPDLAAAAVAVDAGNRATLAERDGTLLALAACVGGAIWGLRDRPTIANASRPATLGSAAGMVDAWLRLRGGSRSRSVVSRLSDPRPERWGRLAPDRVLRELDARPEGLSAEQARTRRSRPRLRSGSGAVARAIAGQAGSPANAVLAGGAVLSLSLGAMGDILMIGAVIVANAAIDAWQERRVDRAAQALEQLTAPEARVLRDGAAVTIPADQVVRGDVLVLAAGDRVPADGRLLTAHDLQVDEAPLTGESLPVAKSVANGAPEHHIVLEGSDVIVGTARAVAVAVGRDTRLGSIAAALDVDDGHASPLAVRLQRMMRQGLPLVLGAGALVAGLGVLRRRSPTEQLAIGASMAVAAVPEGLQLLSTVAAAGVARRLTAHGVLVRSLAAVDALGRVDVVCADKTGTLTLGRPAVRSVATLDAERRVGPRLPAPLRDVIRTAAHASPHPDASGAAAHPTDVAVLEAAEAAELGDLLRVRRERESPFEPARSFHAAVADGRLCVKGAVEAIAPRCRSVRRGGATAPLAGAAELLTRADALAARGLRVLLVAEGDPSGVPEDPRDLVALGFLGIADPLRPGVDRAIARCREAGVRTLMLTGDHPATARAIAREAGLPAGDGAVLSGPEIAELEPGELDRRLEGATVIARITPLDKLRIVESLQRRGHTVAMTGDGVNDAPALRLADVGIAMGRGGTQVARQASDVILTRDDFQIVTEAFVEGRGFWRNMRRALGLLLGGNLGEVGLMVGAAVLGLPTPMTARQILAVNLVTDVLPAIAVAMQPPEHRRLDALAREGTEALDAPLRTDILSRATVTALPSLAAYALAVSRLGARGAPGVAFGSICATQLALTLADGRTDRGISWPVSAAVAFTGLMLAAVLGADPARRFLGWDPLGGAGWTLIGAATAGTAALRGLGRGSGLRLLGGV